MRVLRRLPGLLVLLCLGCSPRTEEVAYTVGVPEGGRLDIPETIFVPIQCKGDCSQANVAWELELKGSLPVSLDLAFSGSVQLLTSPQSADRRGLVPGKGRWKSIARGTIFKVKSGRYTILGLRSREKKDLVASLRPRLTDKIYINHLMKQSRNGNFFLPDAIVISVKQESDGKVVKVKKWRFNLSFSFGFFGIEGGDQVSILNNAGHDNVIALLDVRRQLGGCIRDELWRTPDVREIGNALTPNQCDSEAIVFAKGRAMKIIDTSNIWNDKEGDDLPANLEAASLSIPVQIFVLNEDVAGTEALAVQNVVDANVTYEVSRCGVQFSIAEIADESDIAKRLGLLDTTCGSIDKLLAAIPAKKDRVNFYYLGWPGANGIWCDAGVGLISSSPFADTLAHELGHSLSLTPSNKFLGPSNLMYEAGGVTRGGLTVGQCFRCNMESDSVIRTLGIRTDNPRSCGIQGNDKCPDIDREIQ